MRRFLDYDDGLDADGYPIEVDGPAAYVRGSEAEAGDFKPELIADAAARVVRNVHLFSVDLSRDKTGQ